MTEGVVPEHFLITRYAVRIKPGASLPGEAWLRSRTQAFRDVCMPSVVGQTDNQFTWLIFVDRDSPRWLLDELTSFLPSNAELVLVTGVCEGPAIARAIHERVRATRVITSRVDNDDAIRADYIERVKFELRDTKFGFLNFKHGYQYSRRRLLLYSHPSNAFISLIEPVKSELLTVFADWHPRLSAYAPIRQCLSGRMWIQTCHEGNVKNEERGIRADLRKGSVNYPFLDLRPQKFPEYMLDVFATASRAVYQLLQKPRRILRILGKS